MDPTTIASDDDYDIISNPGHKSIDSSTEDFGLSDVHELPPSEDAQDRFETIRWSATEIQAFVRKGLGSPCSSVKTADSSSRIRVYVDGSFDMFDVSHALQLRQAKLSFPSVYLIAGVFSDSILQQNNESANQPEVERVELLRHCRWVNEVLRDAPWEVTPDFLNSKAIDYVAIDEGTSVNPLCDKLRVKAYDKLLELGKIIKIRRTIGLASQVGRIVASPSQRATPTLPSIP